MVEIEHFSEGPGEEVIVWSLPRLKKPLILEEDLPREASDLIFKIRSCAVRSDLKHKKNAEKTLFLRSDLTVQESRSDLKNKIARFSGEE